LLQTTLAPISLVVIALLGILDAFGLIDTGLGDLTSSFKVWGVSIATMNETLVSELYRQWLVFKWGWLQIFSGMSNALTSLSESLNERFYRWGLITKESYEERRRGIAEERRATQQRFGGKIEQFDAQIRGADNRLGGLFEEDAKKPGFVEFIRNALKAKILDKFGAGAELPDFSSGFGGLGIPGVTEGGVTGFFGTSLAAEKIGGLTGESVDRQQLDVMESMDDKLSKIVENTEAGAVYA